MSIRQLKTFLAVAKHGTFAATAEAVGLTHSAVSLQMKALEEGLCTELFDRTKRPPVLTAQGRALVEQAREVVERYEQMSAAVSRPDDLAGRLLIGAVPSILTGMLPVALRRLQDRHPRLLIEVASGLAADMAARVEAGELDAALVCDPMTPLGPALEWRLVTTEALYVVAPAGAAGETDEELLEAHPYIRFNGRTWTGRFIDSCLSRRRLTVRHRMDLDSMEAVTTMVAHGLGVSIVPRRRFEPPPPLSVKRVPFGAPPVRRQVGMIGRHNRRGASAAAALFDSLKQLLAETGPEEPA